MTPRGDPTDVPAISTATDVASVVQEQHLSPSARRASELQRCAAEFDALLARYDATVQVRQIMVLGEHGGPVYAYDLRIVGR